MSDARGWAPEADEGALGWLHRVARTPFRPLRGFITVPGLISLSGILTALGAIWVDAEFGGDLSEVGLRPFTAETTQTILSTLAGAAMTALSLVYSIVLLVFTLAAGTIAPRLLERFTQDRISQVAVGSLGALFLHNLVTLAAVDRTVVFASVAVAMAMAGLSVLLLLLFVDKVARRVTIDEEISQIASELDGQLAHAAAISSNLTPDQIVVPDGDEAEIRADRSGYINWVDFDALSEKAAAHHGFIDFSAGPGDHVLKGDLLGRAIGGDVVALADAALNAVKIGDRRTAEGDLRFSADLLLEIALRALSPGVNDSFTAVACIDRYVASLAAVASKGLNVSVFCDDKGAARITAPRSDVAELVRIVFGPLRRAVRDNLLVAQACLEALMRLRPKVDDETAAEIDREIEELIAEVDASAALEVDKARFHRLAAGAAAPEVVTPTAA